MCALIIRHSGVNKDYMSSIGLKPWKGCASLIASDALV